MNEIEALANIDIVNVIVGVFFILAAVKFSIELIEYFVKKFGISTKYTKKDEDITDRISVLEQHDITQCDQLGGIMQMLADIKKDNEEYKKKEKDQTVVLYGFLINQFYDRLLKQFKEQGEEYITKEQYESFSAMAEIYLNNDGDHLIKEKVIPFINSLKIK